MKRRTHLFILALAILMLSNPIKSEEEEDDNESWIDSGCIKDKPALCPNGLCMVSYDECDIIMGCTANDLPLMCPNGNCVSNFEDCEDKSYDCVVPEHTRCSDGACRVKCSGIRTNGCSMDRPFFCPTGKCVKTQIQCTDFRCPTFKEPFMCDDLSCKKTPMSCPNNQTSMLIHEEKTQLLINYNDHIKSVYTVWYNQDLNNLALRFYSSGNRLFYDKHTAGFYKLREKSIEEFTGSIHFEPVPFSDFENSKILYEKIDLQVEILTSIIFAKAFSSLKPYEFVRSPAFKFSVENYEYNHFPYASSPSIQIKYTKLDGYPVESKSKDDIRKISVEYEVEYDLTDPSQLYCLGYYDIKQKTWFCVARRMFKYSDHLIEYKLPIPGIYAVLYAPATEMANIEPCSFICQNKKVILSLLLLILPIALLVSLYIKDHIKTLYRLTKQNLVALTAKDDDPFYKKEENEEKPNESQHILDDDNYEIKGDTYTFINPLIFGTGSQNIENSDKELEGQKVKLKFKNMQVLNEKLLILKKLSALNSEIADLKDDIMRLKKLQGINAIYETPGDAGPGI